ncbi:PTS-dependent dihydroxyacetone kinase phosphotransferase subunit DhaM [Tetragenococcus koreensis]|uniref:dihydroxyacetone kinase phosphoryl donor subunit DhaM n=1 Tax=Tetragenococcus koreensis TaxID=290335 RepID=UPI001F1A1CB5|nr:dihydroxyacetone kinase phosphoryl donor subunit DhaM [Tetragenococcus koreensis]MDN6470269.1 PTS-dependent dihydroxyacetone kinase phosphotransferase subunit DhaM [Enterococcaceae bacterium]MCF1586364.1 PTS-dependent dihydroxyacetone kinase phosphotransferase subunit DhaM [Tetragenococcus koreensis]MCF1615919.1 PTS-dependent dihydroxyacetone kinase phosphotransferase subunit DhaM [Tetragenococcus koreensis]MCF1617416.1 PTS-dependent dihydroxyacetone kinase phosphotransferase subunit DhaM [T
MKTSLLLLSHSKEITDGIKKMIEQMQTSSDVSIYSLGGTVDNEIGSDPTKIVDAVNDADKEDSFLVFADIGSAILNAEMAKDMLEEKQQGRYYLVDAPLVEGAFAAAITASTTSDIQQMISEAQKAGEKDWS